VLGQLFLFACVVAMLSIAGIFFVLFGPVPVKRRVTVVPRLSAPRLTAPRLAAPAAPSLVSQLATGDEFFTPPRPVQVVAARPDPIPATAAPVPSLRKPKGGKVQPLPKKRSAKGTESPNPFAPVVRSAGYRQMREEDVATNPVRLHDSDEFSEEFTTVDDSPR
jgi:hypothetical protein